MEDNKARSNQEELAHEAYRRTRAMNDAFRRWLDVDIFSKKINEIAEWYRKELALLI